MVYADLDGLKQINDSFGHKEGDRALMKTAEILRETFRTSDILGRLGGDNSLCLRQSSRKAAWKLLWPVERQVSKVQLAERLALSALR